MIVKLLTEHHLEILSLQGGCRGSSESSHIKMPHCWKSRALAHIVLQVASICSSVCLTLRHDIVSALELKHMFEINLSINSVNHICPRNAFRDICIFLTAKTRGGNIWVYLSRKSNSYSSFTSICTSSDMTEKTVYTISKICKHTIVKR